MKIQKNSYLSINRILTFFILLSVLSFFTACSKIFPFGQKAICTIVLQTHDANIPKDSETKAITELLRNRLSTYDVSAKVQVNGKNNKFIVEIYKTNIEPAQIAEKLCQIGLLTIQEVDNTSSEFTPTGRIIVSGNEVVSAYVKFDQNIGNYVAVKFNEAAAKKFEEGTEKNIGKPLGIFMDDKLISAPTVQEKISGGEATISFGGGNADRKSNQKEAKELAQILNAGPLPYKLKIVEIVDDAKTQP